VAFEPQRTIYDIPLQQLRLTTITNSGALRQAVERVRRHPRSAASTTAVENFGGLCSGGPAGIEVDVITIAACPGRVCAYWKIERRGMEWERWTGARSTTGACNRHCPLENDRRANRPKLISLVFELGYRLCGQLPSPRCSSDNFFGNPQHLRR